MDSPRDFDAFPVAGARVRASCGRGAVAAVIAAENWRDIAAHAALLWSRSPSEQALSQIIADLIAGFALETAGADMRYPVGENSLALTIVYLTLALLSGREQVGALAVRLIRQGGASIDVEIGSGMLNATFRSRDFEHLERYELDAVAQLVG